MSALLPKEPIGAPLSAPIVGIEISEKIEDSEKVKNEKDGLSTI